ncbi:MAG: malate dehydrogenase (oxaloacetate-decarboxylating) [Bacteroidia bacterium]|jgi:malate dehydrogenase (oxaloacetate-decarboxylating)
MTKPTDKYDYFKRSIELHEKLKGKIEIRNKMEVNTTDDLSLVYSPGVAQPCLAIEKDPELAYDLTMKGNTVAVVSDGSAVLGLGNIGAKAAIPVMEGKAMLFKKFANINAFPICLDTQNVDEIVETVKRIAPVFGGVNLEDISAPRSFEVEERLQDIGIPVFHDDQHGTAIVTLAGLINAAKVTGRKLEDLKVVINGAGAAGIAISRLLRCISLDPSICIPVAAIVVCDSKGIIHSGREGLTETKKELLQYSNRNNRTGTLKDAIVDCDVFIGVSIGNILTKEDIETMAKDPIIFALANPTPEIMPEEAIAGGAAVVATGRSDYPNQVNNVLAFPGIFRGALDARAPRITPEMKLASAYAIADTLPNPSQEQIIPSSLDIRITEKVAKAVFDTHTKSLIS